MLRMSPYYRISKYCLEGERGLCHQSEVSTISFVEGCESYSDELQKAINEYNKGVIG